MNKFLFRVEQASFKMLFTVFALVAILFAYIYSNFPSEYGKLNFSYDSAAEINFWDCLYFSVVTISSLGFGDYYPLGWLRVFVGLEVVLGLIFLGILVAKLASEKSAYYLKRLYSGHVHDRIVGFGVGLSEWFSEYSAIVDSNKSSPRLFADKDENIYEELLSISISIRKYIGYEVYFGELFFDISKSSLHSPLDKVKNIIDYLNNNISVDLIKTNANKKRIYKSAKMYITACKTIDKYANIDSLHKKSREIIKSSEKLKNKIEVLDIK
ncbi:potassium channel family protein [Marinobacter alexandrii]|uniref:potassium channel family protein n=1 Tax=Marinobacter alexandrii TaxID=2570351 RepID=UPI001FFFEAAA|nr:potassium channel family protein [Marinobacter alexandrii]MCK2149609.1 potassium channel family protein [Marinobacter alexandrii]